MIESFYVLHLFILYFIVKTLFKHIQLAEVAFLYKGILQVRSSVSCLKLWDCATFRAMHAVLMASHTSGLIFNVSCITHTVGQR